MNDMDINQVYRPTIHLRHGLFFTLTVLSLTLTFAHTSLVLAEETGIPGRNVNVVGPPFPGSSFARDHGLRQQNEPSCAVNPEHPLQICCGFNDYRGIDIPELGDSWQGLSCSRDGGHSWNSQLLPGHRADAQYSLGYDFAADPNLVSVPGGLIFNYIAANRADHVGGIYAQQFLWRNKEDGWPLIQLEGPILISKGTSGRFIDKPHMAGFLDDNEARPVTLTWNGPEGSQSRQLPAGDLGMAAAIFTGNDNNDGTMIKYWSSKDWGNNWNNGTKLTESKGINSGVNIASNGDNVCVVWRRFSDVNESSSILYACSANRGKTFTKPMLLHDMCPFDQATLNGSSTSLPGETTPRPDMVAFRTNAFPAIAADGQRFYVFWSDRGYAEASGYQQGCQLKNADGGFNPSYGRIVYSVTSNGGETWSAPVPVEDAPAGHQFMPAAFGANGEVMLTWIDSRDDIANHLEIDKQFIVDFWRADQALYRHTTDIRSARFKGNGTSIAVSPSIKVSNFTKGLIASGNQLQLRQLEYNLVNARLFQKGTAPFVGDYLSVTAKAYNKDPLGRWRNANVLTEPQSPVFHISWTDNRDIRGNAWGDADANGFSSPSPYTPTQSNQVNAITSNEVTENAMPSVQDPADNQQIACSAASVKADRTRDQNVYYAPVYPATLLRAPGAIKFTDTLQRAFPIFIKNNTSESYYYRLQITAQPEDFAGCTGLASFRQYPLPEGQCPLEPVDSLWVKVHAASSAVRTLFITSTTAQLSDVPVQAHRCPVNSTGEPDTENCQLASAIVINQDFLNNGNTLEQPSYSSDSILASEIHNPDLLNPDLLNPDLLNLLVANPDLLNPDLLNPDLLNPDLLNPDLLNPDLLNPDLLNPDLLNPDLLNLILLNPDLLNPDLLNPDLLNPDLLNPDLLNPDLLNLLIANPDLLNPDLLNPDLLNPDLLNPDLLNTSLSYADLENPELANSNPDNADDYYIDVTWQVKNSGNTATGYMAQAFIAGPEEHNGTQLIVSKPYLRQTTRDCLPVVESDNHVVVNILNPPNVEPTPNPDPTEKPTQGLASFWIEPGEVANITLRIFADDPGKLHSSRAGLYVNAEACNTGEICADQPYARTTRKADFSAPVMSPAVLPDINDLEATSSLGAIVEYIAPTAYDEGDEAEIPVACDYENGALVPLGNTLNTCRAADSVGNTAEVSFSIDVVDSTAPILTVPETLTIESAGPDGAIVTYATSSTDIVDEDVSTVCLPASGSLFPLGLTTVVCEATDDSGNIVTSTFEVHIVDTHPPVLTLPETIITGVNSATGALVNYTVQATDQIDTDVTITCTPASGSIFGVGDTTVTCIATDDSGNSTQGSFMVQVLADIVWIKPLEDPAYDTLGPNLNLRWGYGVPGQLVSSEFMLATSEGQNTAPVLIYYQGNTCAEGQSIVVDIDAGNSSLRYDDGVWLLNWQTGQSLMNGNPITPGCYRVEIPRSDALGGSDTRHIILSN